MKRVYHHYTKCEEFAAGMWRIVPAGERDSFVEKSAELMRDPQRFAEAMLRAVKEWPRSCEQNMTAPSVNHQAWFGHAGCCLAHGSPEDLTRLAWHTLNQKEQDAANAAADLAIEEWHRQEALRNMSAQLLIEEML